MFYYDLNNSALDFYLVLSKPFLNFELVPVVNVRFLYDVIHQVDYQIGQKDKYKPIQIVQDITEQI